jgi:hypothetical protein
MVPTLSRNCKSKEHTISICGSSTPVMARPMRSFNTQIFQSFRAKKLSPADMLNKSAHLQLREIFMKKS